MTAHRKAAAGKGPVADVTIVGAGVVGLLSALALRREGLSVTLVDRDFSFTGCSYGNAGSISPGSAAPLAMPGVMKQVPGWLFDPLGPLTIRPSYALRAAPWLLRFVRASRPARVEEISRAQRALLGTALELYRNMLNEIGQSGLLKATGQLQLYPDPASMKKDQAVWRLRRARGVTVQDVSRDDIRQLEPAVGEAYQCGVYLPDEGMIVNPGALLQVCAAALERNGASFVNADVRGIEFGADGPVSLKTSEGPVPLRALVIAAGAWSARLAKTLDGHVPLETQRGYHAMFPQSGVELRRPVVAADAKCFVTPMEHGLRIAGTVEFAGLDAEPDMRRADALFRHARRMFPQLAAREKTTWMGHRPCMPDTLPVIGRSPNFRNVFYAFGHGHLGLTGAPMTARLIADLVLDRAPAVDVSPYRFDRF